MRGFAVFDNVYGRWFAGTNSRRQAVWSAYPVQPLFTNRSFAEATAMLLAAQRGRPGLTVEIVTLKGAE
jgi:hypothetical protein